MKKCILALLAISILSSCSVVMAAKKEGTSIDRVQSLRTRTQVIATGAQIVSSERNECGELVETYQIKKEKGSIPRAFMHGCLDLCTFGAWEVIGTPIEGFAGKSEYFCLRITYDSAEVIKRMELM